MTQGLFYKFIKNFLMSVGVQQQRRRRWADRGGAVRVNPMLVVTNQG